MGFSALLANGKVLIAGGYVLDPSTGEQISSASAEIFDPSAGIWSPAAPLSEPWRDAAAVTLLDGRVLIVGGEHTNVNTAELYNPATNTWSFAAHMIYGRAGHTATLLRDGRVLVQGEYPAEIYDPTTNTWSLTTPMARVRKYSTATLLSDGRILVVGGTYDGFSSFALPEIYDPTTNSWSSGGTPVGTLRLLHTATLLADGKVLIAGGRNYRYGIESQVALAEVYDPNTNTWAVAGSLTRGRSEHGASKLPNGKVMVTGGCVNSGTPINITEIYDPATNLWTSGLPMPDISFAAQTVTLNTGQILITAGWSGTSPTQVTFLFTPASSGTAILYPTRDAMVSNYPTYLNLNFGNLPYFRALSWTSGNVPFSERSLIQFDPNQIPVSNAASIKSATLYLYGVDHNPLTTSNACNLLFVSSNWDEATVTWNTQPAASYIIQQLAKSSSSTQDYQLDVTQFVQLMKTSGGGSLMLELQSENRYTKMVFASKEYSDVSKRPKLVVVYNTD